MGMKPSMRHKRLARSFYKKVTLVDIAKRFTPNRQIGDIISMLIEANMRDVRELERRAMIAEMGDNRAAQEINPHE